MTETSAPSTAEPIVSVVMPVYNAARYVSRAVQSVLDQTFKQFEFIIINDGSTDNSTKILQNFAARDPRIRLITRPNSGVAKSLNHGVAHATGKYIARMDADDICLPLRFEKQTQYLDEHPQCVALGTAFLLIDPYDVPQYEPKILLNHKDIQTALLACVGWSILHPAAMFRRHAIESIGRYRTDLEPSEDLDLYLRLADIGQLANLPDVLMLYRQHTTSINHTRFEQQNQNKRRIITEAYARRGLPLPDGWTPPKRDVIPIDKEIDMWAWSALRQGHLSAARKHALAHFRIHPFHPHSWRLLFCTLRGH